MNTFNDINDDDFEEDFMSILEETMTQLPKSQSNYSSANAAKVAFKFNIEGRTVSFSGGGQGSWRDLPTTPSLVVCIRGNESIVPPAHLRVAAYYPLFVPIPSPDYQAPLVPASFWKDLVDDIVNEGSITSVHFECMGGKGRTGTFMSIVYGLLSPKKFKDSAELINEVRGLYYGNAVESKVQMEYIAKVLGIKYVEMPDKHEVKAAATEKAHGRRLSKAEVIERLEAILPGGDANDIEAAASDYIKNGDGCAQHKIGLIFLGGKNTPVKLTEAKFKEFCQKHKIEVSAGLWIEYLASKEDITKE